MFVSVMTKSVSHGAPSAVEVALSLGFRLKLRAYISGHMPINQSLSGLWLLLSEVKMWPEGKGFHVAAAA